MASCGFFLSLLLGIVIDSTFSQSKNDFGNRITLGNIYSISAVETIADSRFQLLAADFQGQIDYLKGKLVKESKTSSKEVLKSKNKHGIKKRQTKTVKPNKYANKNSSCAYFYPDYPDAGLEKLKTVTIEMPKAGKEVIKKHDNNKTKSIKPICEHSTPLCTYNHPDHHRVSGVNGNNSTTVVSNQTAQDPTEVNKSTASCKDTLWEEMKVLQIQSRNQSQRIDQLEQHLALERNLAQLLSTTREETMALKIENMDQSNKIYQLENKIAGEQHLAQLLTQARQEMMGVKTQNMDQSYRIDQLEQKVAMLQNVPSPSPGFTRGNNQYKMKSGGSNNIEGQVSEALTPPSSCQDLAMLDYYLDGLYLVKNKQTKNIQTVLCKFSADNKGYETIIGYNDIKTAPISFLVTSEDSVYSKISTTIHFDTEVFNLGGAMNLRTGVFTAPKNGRYSFSFKTRSYYNKDAQLYFRVNGNRLLYVEGFSDYENMPISTVLDLKAHDKVDCYLSRGSIDHNIGGTFFSGILLEEDLTIP